MNETVKRTQEELVDELRARFGDEQKDWAFICPACSDVASLQDFRDALAATGSDDHPMRHLGQICIGRVLGALKRDQPTGRYDGRGCDWAAFGLFQGPEFVVMPDGREVPSFAIAPIEAAVA
ncbi:hypothetical protein PTQ19_07050 [Microbacterium esteraromaticum]|uniref:VVA0879 family protein n=1 Tax=Microbacterium esteraromaticum TaxID=57043 RepID=UPI00236821F7|nr:VVA0879 family protein [Microbacterium esteraromaticum]WDH80180.1 hypothetical protein PTQ19_07050 [Microbacterium esteraromaticum]